MGYFKNLFLVVSVVLSYYLMVALGTTTDMTPTEKMDTDLTTAMATEAADEGMDAATMAPDAKGDSDSMATTVMDSMDETTTMGSGASAVQIPGIMLFATSLVSACLRY